MPPSWRPTNAHKAADLVAEVHEIERIMNKIDINESDAADRFSACGANGNSSSALSELSTAKQSMSAS
jgi:hypothetical protein